MSWQLVKACLDPKRHKLLVYEDGSHQSDADTSPIYPVTYGVNNAGADMSTLEKLEQARRDRRFLTVVVRSPGAARDPAMHFCRALFDKSSREGRTEFYRLVNEDVKGELLCRDLHRASAVRDALSDHATYSDVVADNQTSSWLVSESEAHDAAYARALASELSSLAELCSRPDAFMEWGRVAVLTPGATMPSGWHEQLRQDAMQHASGAAHGALQGATAASTTPASQLFLGPVELLAGLDREFVIILGFTHPLRLRATKPHLSTKGRVDSSIYQAITRATYRVAVLEPHAPRLMRHFMLRKLDPATQTVPYFDEHGETAEASVLVESGGERFLRSKLSLLSLSELVRLPEAEQSTVTNLDLKQRMGRDELESAFGNGFAWDRLKLLSSLRIGLHSITTPVRSCGWLRRGAGCRRSCGRLSCVAAGWSRWRGLARSPRCRS